MFWATTHCTLIEHQGWIHFAFIQKSSPSLHHHVGGEINYIRFYKASDERIFLYHGLNVNPPAEM